MTPNSTPTSRLGGNDTRASGKCEVVFQYMAIRPPFDDVELRQEFRNRLNKISGVDLPEAKLELRPGFPLELLTDEPSRRTFIDALTWFYYQANPAADGVHHG